MLSLLIAILIISIFNLLFIGAFSVSFIILMIKKVKKELKQGRYIYESKKNH